MIAVANLNVFEPVIAAARALPQAHFFYTSTCEGVLLSEQARHVVKSLDLIEVIEQIADFQDDALAFPCLREKQLWKFHVDHDGKAFLECRCQCAKPKMLQVLGYPEIPVPCPGTLTFEVFVKLQEKTANLLICLESEYQEPPV